MEKRGTALTVREWNDRKICFFKKNSRKQPKNNIAFNFPLC